MFIIGEAVIEEPVAHERFACDLDGCRGACCTLPGGRGAPLEDDEVEKIEAAYSHAAKYLSAERKAAIQRSGFVEGVPGHFATACIDDRDCVFVFYDEGIAKCSLERAFINGETQWWKPISCHLFPIRISHGSSDRLRYERIPECSPAIRNGKSNGVHLSDFLCEALIRKYGTAWYEEFQHACEQRRVDGTAVK
jgi:hypothetical protein